jgi:hypothetical protein
MHRKILLMLTILTLSIVGTAYATTITLSDGNSSAKIDTASQAGMYEWKVDGVNQLYQQWFWYRIGTTGQENSINSINFLAPVISGNGSNMTDIKYTASNFTLTLSYTLMGGLDGSGTADISKIIRINNTSGSSLDFHLFQYSNFYVGGTPNNIISFNPTASNTLTQSNPSGTAYSETVVTPSPSRWEISYFNDTRNKLNDLLPTTLTNTNTTSPASPGDVTWAFEWDKVLRPGQSLLISNDTGMVVPVQEPMTLILLCTGLAGTGLYGKLLRRKNKILKIRKPKWLFEYQSIFSWAKTS